MKKLIITAAVLAFSAMAFADDTQTPPTTGGDTNTQAAGDNHAMGEGKGEKAGGMEGDKMAHKKDHHGKKGHHKEKHDENKM